jgi:hypothetical protein
MMIQQGDANLPQMIGACRASGGFPRRLNGRQQERDQGPDDRDDRQQLDERERAARADVVARSPDLATRATEGLHQV